MNQSQKVANFEEKGSLKEEENTNSMNNVEELMRILQVARMLHEQQQINLLVNHIAELEKSREAVMLELADIKNQLNEALSRSSNDPVVSENKHIFSKLMEQTNSAMTARIQKLQNIKQDLNQKAHKVVQGFKDTGIKALNKVCEFLGIKEKLIVMRDQARSAEMEMKNAVEKIDAVEKELSSAVSHIGNAGRIVSGKEKDFSKEHLKGQMQTEHKGPALFRLFRNHYQKRQNVYAKRVEKLNRAIEKFQALEQKASVLRKLSNNKEKVAGNDKDAGNNRAVPTSDHKREDNIR